MPAGTISPTQKCAAALNVRHSVLLSTFPKASSQFYHALIKLHETDPVGDLHDLLPYLREAQRERLSQDNRAPDSRRRSNKVAWSPEDVRVAGRTIREQKNAEAAKHKNRTADVDELAATSPPASGFVAVNSPQSRKRPPRSSLSAEQNKRSRNDGPSTSPGSFKESSYDDSAEIPKEYMYVSDAFRARTRSHSKDGAASRPKERSAARNWDISTFQGPSVVIDKTKDKHHSPLGAGRAGNHIPGLPHFIDCQPRQTQQQHGDLSFGDRLAYLNEKTGDKTEPSSAYRRSRSDRSKSHSASDRAKKSDPGTLPPPVKVSHFSTSQDARLKTDALQGEKQNFVKANPDQQMGPVTQLAKLAPKPLAQICAGGDGHHSPMAHAPHDEASEQVIQQKKVNDGTAATETSNASQHNQTATSATGAHREIIQKDKVNNEQGVADANDVSQLDQTAKSQQVQHDRMDIDPVDTAPDKPAMHTESTQPKQSLTVIQPAPSTVTMQPADQQRPMQNSSDNSGSDNGVTQGIHHKQLKLAANRNMLHPEPASAFTSNGETSEEALMAALAHIAMLHTDWHLVSSIQHPGKPLQAMPEMQDAVEKLVVVIDPDHLNEDNTKRERLLLVFANLSTQTVQVFGPYVKAAQTPECHAVVEKILAPLATEGKSWVIEAIPTFTIPEEASNNTGETSITTAHAVLLDTLFLATLTTVPEPGIALPPIVPAMLKSLFTNTPLTVPTDDTPTTAATGEPSFLPPSPPRGPTTSLRELIKYEKRRRESFTTFLAQQLATQRAQLAQTTTLLTLLPALATAAGRLHEGYAALGSNAQVQRQDAKDAVTRWDLLRGEARGLEEKMRCAEVERVMDEWVGELEKLKAVWEGVMRLAGEMGERAAGVTGVLFGMIEGVASKKKMLEETAGGMEEVEV